MVALDLIWFIVMSSVWGKEVDNDYWKSQSGMQSFALVFCWVQIALKGFIDFYLFVDFKGKYPNETSFLFNFNYVVSQQQSSSDDKETNRGNDFNENPY